MNIIVAFPKKEITQKLNSILLKNGFEVTATCTTGAQVLNAASELHYGIILCSIRFSDMMYHEIKESLSDHYEIVVLAKSNHWEHYGDDDVICIPMPLKVYDLIDTLEDVVWGMHKRIQKEKTKPKQRSEEDKSIILEAKKMLMDIEGYTEEGAHRLIQKESMDSGSNMVETATRIIEYMSRRKEKS